MRTSGRRRLAGLALASLLGGCTAASPTAPSTANPPATSLQSTIAPDLLISQPEPGCDGGSAMQHVWRYTLTLSNAGTRPYLVRRLRQVVTDVDEVVVRTLEATAVAAAFGTTSIPPGGSIAGTLCLGSAPYGLLAHVVEGPDGSAASIGSGVQLWPGIAFDPVWVFRP